MVCDPTVQHIDFRPRIKLQAGARAKSMIKAATFRFESIQDALLTAKSQSPDSERPRVRGELDS